MTYRSGNLPWGNAAELPRVWPPQQLQLVRSMWWSFSAAGVGNRYLGVASSLNGALIRALCIRGQQYIHGILRYSV